ncbi:Ig-like domain-containing protein [uncultured Zobellia sp.]|uniref:Ig-like domain-containing protein n=1 Tax=uncultured Zobellia sp. TaxID=255433 RepID=UPI00259A33DE|nr:Ig-like domain-containing protein [uncultured Zobellia sp.]
MKIIKLKVINLTMLLLALFLSISCSKDTDLLAEYVISDAEQARLTGNVLINDSYVINGKEAIVLDVLSNDILENPEKVKIVETSQPKNGSVIINDDNTLTYVPDGVNEKPETNIPQEIPTETEEEEPSEDTEEKSKDSFTYTIEIEQEDGKKETSDASVIVSNDFDELKAFPTAEGFGKNATGGRGGIVVEVTNLNDSGPGSFREALKMKQKRTIVFKVGGTIECNDYLSIPIGSGNVTIAGQTAPGDGILIKGGELRVQESNVIIRYLRFRVGKNPKGTSNLDGIKIRSYKSESIKNIIIDHCSVTWGQDENISITNAENVTVQNSIIGECNLSVLLQRAERVSFLNNLFSLSGSRNIKSNTISPNEITFEFINNIVYGFKWGTAGTKGMAFNVIENSYKLSKDFKSNTKHCITLAPAAKESKDLEILENTHAYFKGNEYNPNELDLYRPESKSYVQLYPKNTSDYIPTDAGDLDNKLLGHVGASYPVRDAVDTRLINSYFNAEGVVKDYGTFPNIANGIDYSDIDKDGMSDDWENENGLDSNSSKDGSKDRNNDGYTNLEDFLYYLLNS